MRLIDADALIEAHYDYCCKHQGEADIFYVWSLQLMKDAPTVAIWHTEEPNEYGNYIVWVETEKYTGLEMDYYASYGWDDWQGGVVAWLEILSPIMIGGNK